MVAVSVCALYLYIHLWIHVRPASLCAMKRQQAGKHEGSLDEWVEREMEKGSVLYISKEGDLQLQL